MASICHSLTSLAGYITKILLQANVHQCNMMFKKKQVGSCQRQVAFFTDLESVQGFGHYCITLKFREAKYSRFYSTGTFGST